MSPTRFWVDEHEHKAPDHMLMKMNEESNTQPRKGPEGAVSVSQGTWHVDGFTLGPNPSPHGGGFTVIGPAGQLVVSHTLYRPMTCNEAELLAVAFAVWRASSQDVIYTDSQTAFYWIRSGVCKSRPDLTTVARKTKHWIQTKSLTVTLVPRERNLAGHYNEQHQSQ
jgi:ribonuclease HI